MQPTTDNSMINMTIAVALFFLLLPFVMLFMNQENSRWKVLFVLALYFAGIAVFYNVFGRCFILTDLHGTTTIDESLPIPPAPWRVMPVITNLFADDFESYSTGTVTSINGGDWSNAYIGIFNGY